MNYFEYEEDFSDYNAEELLNLSLTYLIDVEDLLDVNTASDY